MRRIKYAIVRATSLDLLEIEVNAGLDNGWVCLGGITINRECIYLQAMTKEVWND